MVTLDGFLVGVNGALLSLQRSVRYAKKKIDLTKLLPNVILQFFLLDNFKLKSVVL